MNNDWLITDPKEQVARIRASNTAIVQATYTAKNHYSPRGMIPCIAQVPDAEQRLRDWRSRIPQQNALGNSFGWQYKPKSIVDSAPKHVFKWQTKTA